MAEKASKKIDVVVSGFEVSSEKFGRKSYEHKATNNTTVLDALIHIKESREPSLSFRYSCRMGICGSCAMVINGKPRLACETKVLDLGAGTIVVEPMKGLPLLKSLVTDFDDFFQKHQAVFPRLIEEREGSQFNSRKETKQTAKERDSYLPFAECIKCGLCLDACPVANTNKRFLGPQALAQAYRYNEDSRDEGKGKRLEQLDTLEGAWGCEFSGSCSVVCPKSVDPALAIQLLKADIAKYRLFGKRRNKKKG